MDVLLCVLGGHDAQYPSQDGAETMERASGLGLSEPVYV